MAPQSASFAAASSSLQQLVTAAKSQLTSSASDMDKLKLLICSLEERLHSDKQKHLLHCDDNIVSVPPGLPPICTTTPASTPSIIPSPILSAAAVAAPVLKLCKRPGCGRHLPTPSASNDPYLMRMLHDGLWSERKTCTVCKSRDKAAISSSLARVTDKFPRSSAQPTTTPSSSS